LTEEKIGVGILRSSPVSDSVDDFLKVVTTDFRPETVQFRSQVYTPGRDYDVPGPSSFRTVAVLGFSPEDLAAVEAAASETPGPEVSTWVVGRADEWLPLSLNEHFISDNAVSPGTFDRMYGPSGVFDTKCGNRGFFLVTSDGEVYPELRCE